MRLLCAQSLIAGAGPRCRTSHHVRVVFCDRLPSIEGRVGRCETANRVWRVRVSGSRPPVRDSPTLIRAGRKRLVSTLRHLGRA